MFELYFFMNIAIQQANKQKSFKGMTPYSLTAAFENRVLLNKAVFDVTCSDIPYVIMANNKEERRERINRSVLSFGLVFASPLLLLPLINRGAVKHIAGLTNKLMSKEHNIIKLSNKYLTDAEKTEEGLKELSKELGVDFNPVLERAENSYDTLRKRIINAKNTVLGCDFLLITGTFGNIGFFNNWQTRKRTGQKGYSAEMGMANKDIVENRAKDYEKSSKTRFRMFMGILAGIVGGVPFAIKQGLSSSKSNKFTKFVVKHCEKFDYTNAIFMKRLPLAIGLIGAHTGIVLASRNNTELKDNAIRSSIPLAIFFGGDILMTSALGRLSDAVLKTKIINREKTQNKFLHKILPPTHSLNELEKIGCKTSKNVGMGLFWFNFAFLSALIGFVTPALINHIIKKDVSKDIEKIDNKS